MNNTKSSQCNIFNKLANTKGRFFGLYLTNGEVINAKFKSQTDSYFTVYDRATKTTRKFRKTSVARATV